MKILFLGEYSNLHWTIAQGLRVLGHDVTVASAGDRYKDYRRNVNLSRKSYGTIDTISFTMKLMKEFRNFKNYDVVQIVNPVFIDLKPEKNLMLYNYLKKHNKKVFLGAFGVDHYWLKACLDKKTFRYSEFCIGDRDLNIPEIDAQIKDWIGSPREEINKSMAASCDGIIACLYEYYVSYLPEFSDKLTYIPEPVNLSEAVFKQKGGGDIVKFFIGIQTKRSQIKGTDVLYKVLKEVHKKYPAESVIKKVEEVPYKEYICTMNDSDVLLDQLYSYTPAMNALMAMGQGLVVVGGAEPEAYEILNETENKPVINVIPDEQDIFDKLEQLILNKRDIPRLSAQSREFVEKHHDYVKIAQQYVDFWLSR